MGTLFIDTDGVLGVTVSPHYDARGLKWVSVIGVTAKNELVDYVSWTGLVSHEKNHQHGSVNSFSAPGILFIDCDGDLSITLGNDRVEGVNAKLCSFIWFEGYFVSTYKESPRYAYTYMRSLLA